MFYESVKAAWEERKVHIGLPAFAFREPTITGRGWLYAFKVFLLNGKERQALIDMAEHEVACVAQIFGEVEDWTPEQRETVRRSLRKFGFPVFPPSQRELEASTPQRRLLIWEGRQRAKQVLERTL
ncbi:hypothetical protein [Pseudomonas sp. P108]|uniref:hypothetical protein n=1 Tax=Pseudomonas sp. P108 TaxID=1837993 RepID=UPI002934667C|nr:hypothetical protein [Pseudomonas sp. P108]WNZ87593.1 hypothetical protein QOM10_30365 [Pseudomonas sp. P108]